jgi:hypothetical protein
MKSICLYLLLAVEMLVGHLRSIGLLCNDRLNIIHNFHLDIELDFTAKVFACSALFRVHFEFGGVSTWIFRSL